METMLTVINFKVLALSHLLPPSSLPACYICAGFGEKKSQYPNKGQNLKTGSFFGGGRGGVVCFLHSLLLEWVPS